jgi:lysophospholipase L1-like esterase
MSVRIEANGRGGDRVDCTRNGMAALLLAVGWLGIGAASPASAVDGLLVVGDSWAEQQWDDQAHALVFDAVGQVGVAVYGAATAESGTTAADWIQPARLQVLADELAQRADVDVVQLTLGGNDFLNAWSTALSPADESDLLAAVQADLATILEFVLDQRPDVEVLLSFYDYPNFVDTLDGIVGLFVCRPLWNDLGQPDPRQLNSASTRFERAIASLADAHPRVFHVSHLGLMQAQFGFPSDGIPPGQLSPPGDLDLPSPVEAMRLGGDDCFHLNAEGYDGLVLNQYDGYFEDRFEVIFRSRFR